MSGNDICFMRQMGETCEPDECVESCEIYDTVYNTILIRNPNPDKKAWSPMYVKVDRRSIEKQPQESMTEQEAMDAIEKRPEDSMCHSVGGKLCAPKEQKTEFVRIFEGSIEKSIEGIRAFREKVAIEEKGLTSFQIKAILEDTARNMRKVKEYCESTDYNTEVYEYHNSDCFYHELHEIHSMSWEIIQNFKKKSFTSI